MFLSNPNFPIDLPSPTDHIFPPLNSFSNHEKFDVQFNYLQTNHDPYEFLFQAYNNTAAVAPPTVMQNIVTTVNQDFVWQQHKFSERSGLQYREDGRDDLLDSVISSYSKKIATYKKDGNRKINTARGLRDRRVRFSTEIAAKFFGLQDLLGFDRASKTLDWLFTNSVSAIKELVGEKNHDSSDQSNLKFLENIINGGSDENINGGKKKSVVKCIDGKKMKTKRKCKAGFGENDVSRDQSRAAARARARERTREKMRVKKLDDDSKLTLMKPGGCWSEIKPESDYRNIRCECIMDQETKYSSSLYTSLYQNLEHYFHEQQVIMQLGDLERRSLASDRSAIID